MNWDVIKGNWKQFKGNVHEQWGKLTDDHLDVIAGKREILSGKIQEAYGVTKDADGLWKVDFAKTGLTARVKLISKEWTEAPLNRNRVEVVFLAANVQIN